MPFPPPDGVIHLAEYCNPKMWCAWIMPQITDDDVYESQCSAVFTEPEEEGSGWPGCVATSARPDHQPLCRACRRQIPEPFWPHFGRFVEAWKAMESEDTCETAAADNSEGGASSVEVVVRDQPATAATDWGAQMEAARRVRELVGLQPPKAGSVLLTHG